MVQREVPLDLRRSSEGRSQGEGCTKTRTNHVKIAGVCWQTAMSRRDKELRAQQRRLEKEEQLRIKEVGWRLQWEDVVTLTW